MKNPRDIIESAERYRSFHFIPGNRYNPDVVEKIHLANALLIAVEALEWAAEESCEVTESGLKEDTAVSLKLYETLSRIRSLPGS